MEPIVFGTYELLRKIAAGGMAEIFLARQWGASGFFRDLVIKRLFPHLAEHPEVLAMFELEARLLAEMSHPNIPQVYDLGCEEGQWYVAMEFIDGHTVADLWRSGARAGAVMPLPVALGIVVQACDALHHAHERTDHAGRPLSVVHCDVTPHNLMVTRDGVVKLLDFGVAHSSAQTQGRRRRPRGTYAYMAPEQVKGRPFDQRADVFAVGVILYELTTGTRLFQGGDVEAMTAIVERDAPRPSSRIAGYPRDLERIVLGALQRRADERVGSCAELALELEHFAVSCGLIASRRVLSDYVRRVAPAARATEQDVALVPDDYEHRFDEPLDPTVPDAIVQPEERSRLRARYEEVSSQDEPPVSLGTPKQGKEIDGSG